MQPPVGARLQSVMSALLSYPAVHEAAVGEAVSDTDQFTSLSYVGRMLSCVIADSQASIMIVERETRISETEPAYAGPRPARRPRRAGATDEFAAARRS